jgi:hypothetical protein
MVYVDFGVEIEKIADRSRCSHALGERDMRRADTIERDLIQSGSVQQNTIRSSIRPEIIAIAQARLRC